MSVAFPGSVVEDAALAWLKSVGWHIVHCPDIEPERLAAEPRDYGEVVLAQRLRGTRLPKLSSDELPLNDVLELLGSARWP